MSGKQFIPIPPPAPMPQSEQIDSSALLEEYLAGRTDLLCVMGPTASGKTRYAVSLANDFIRSGHKAEIISADSRQVYKGMDIGTGKDISEYGDIPYHLIDIVPAGQRYDICRYQRDFSSVYRNCLDRGVIPILCGGSGLYVEAVSRPGYDLPDNASLALLLPEKTYYIATLVDRQSRRDRIDARLDARLEEGLVREVQVLLDSGVEPERLIRYGLEYKWVTEYILGQWTFEEMRFHLQNAIHQFAKRQMTWLRGMEKDGVKIHWVEV